MAAYRVFGDLISTSGSERRQKGTDARGSAPLVSGGVLSSNALEL
jgi:hypothetical protein